MEQISQQVVFSIYVAEQENAEDGCQPGESEPINSTVPSLQKSTADSLKRCRKQPDGEMHVLISRRNRGVAIISVPPY